jgi:site-specific DNA recombinase
LRAGVYVRISQDRQGKEAGVRRQENLCRDLAETLGWEVVEVYSDNDISASSGRRRPAYDQLWKDVASGKINAVVAYHSKRLYRKLSQLETLISLVETHGGVPIKTVASGDIDLSTATGRAYARILASLGQLESEEMGERIKGSKHEARTQGKYLGGPRPWGYNIIPGKGLVIHAGEARILKEAANRILAGESLTRVTADLNARGVKTNRGSRWTPGNFRRLLLRPTHAGIFPEGKDGSWEAIFSKREHRLLKARLDNLPRIPGRFGARRYILTGLIRCAECQTPLVGGSGNYVCNKVSGGCGALTVKAKDVELMAIQGAPLQTDTRKQAVPSEDNEQILQDMEKLESRRDALADAYSAGNLSIVQFQRTASRIEQEQKYLEGMLTPTQEKALAIRERTGDETKRPQAKELFRRWRKGNLSKVDINLLSAYLQDVYETIIVRKATRRGFFDNRRITLVRKGVGKVGSVRRTGTGG